MAKCKQSLLPQLGEFSSLCVLTACVDFKRTPRRTVL